MIVTNTNGNSTVSEHREHTIVLSREKVNEWIVYLCLLLSYLMRPYRKTTATYESCATGLNVPRPFRALQISWFTYKHWHKIVCFLWSGNESINDWSDSELKWNDILLENAKAFSSVFSCKEVGSWRKGLRFFFSNNGVGYTLSPGLYPYVRTLKGELPVWDYLRNDNTSPTCPIARADK